MSDPTPEPTPPTPAPEPTQPEPTPPPAAPAPTPPTQPSNPRNDQSVMDAINSLPEKIAQSVASVLEAKPPASPASPEPGSGGAAHQGSGGAKSRRSFAQMWFGS